LGTCGDPRRGRSRGYPHGENEAVAWAVELSTSIGYPRGKKGGIDGGNI